MLWSRRVLLIVAISLFSLQTMAKDSSEVAQKNLCNRILAKAFGPAKQAFDQSLFLAKRKLGLQYVRQYGFGQRGFLSDFPAPTAANAAKYEPYGIYWWGHSFAVMKSIEEAKLHDAQFKGLSKIWYFISEIDVSDLNDETPKEIVRARYAQIVASARMVSWDDSEAMVSNEPIPAEFVEADMSWVRRLIRPDTIEYFTHDDRGPRFTHSGWVFPKIRGEMNYAKLFESGSKSIRSIKADARKKLARGYTYTFNENFLEALNAARDQIRVQKNPLTGKVEKVPANSRYFNDPAEYNLALEGYKTGQSFSVETRHNGKLIAGILGVRNGNLVSLETIFYGYDERADGTFRSQIDDAKSAVLAAVERLKEHGLEVSDVRMVTPFTASMKGEYVTGKVFLQHVKKLEALGPVQIDFSRPWIPE